MSETLTIELPDNISAAVRAEAAARGISLSQFLAEIAMLHARDGASAYLRSRASRADWVAFEKVFGTDRAGGDEPPREGDELES